MNAKKIIAPLIVTGILILYFLFFIFVIINIADVLWVKVLGIIVSLIFIGVSISVLVERIKEIRSDEKDDLSKY